MRDEKQTNLLLVLIVLMAVGMMAVTPLGLSIGAGSAWAQSDNSAAEEEEEEDEEIIEPTSVAGAYQFRAPKKLSLMASGKPNPEGIKGLAGQVAALNTQMEKVCKQLKILVDHSKNMTKHVNALKTNISKASRK